MNVAMSQLLSRLLRFERPPRSRKLLTEFWLEEKKRDRFHASQSYGVSATSGEVR